MSTVMRALLGIGLFAFAFQLGRAVGRLDPLAEDLRRMKGRQGIVIEGEKAEEVPQENDD